MAIENSPGAIVPPAETIPAASLDSFHLVLNDAETGDEHPSFEPLFFSLADSYWAEATRGFWDFELTVQDILDGFHGDLPEGSIEPWATVTVLPWGSSPERVIADGVELKAYLREAYRSACCIGWATAPDHRESDR